MCIIGVTLAVTLVAETVVGADDEAYFDTALTAQERQPAASPEPIKALLRSVATGEVPLLSHPQHYGAISEASMNLLGSPQDWPAVNCCLHMYGSMASMGQTPEQWAEYTAMANRYIDSCHERGILVFYGIANLRYMVNYRTSADDEGPLPEELKTKPDGTKWPDAPCFNSPAFRERVRKTWTKIFSGIAFDGLYFEEPGYWNSAFSYGEEDRVAFRQRLISKYGQAEAEEVVGMPLAELKLPADGERMDNRGLWYEWYDFCQAALADILATSGGYAKAAAKARWGKDIITGATVAYTGVLHHWGGLRQTQFLARPEMSGMQGAWYWQDFDYAQQARTDTFKSYRRNVLWCKSQTAGKPLWFWEIAKNEPDWVFETQVYNSLMGGIDGVWPFDGRPETYKGTARAFGFWRANTDCLAQARHVSPIAILNSYEQANFELWPIHDAFTYYRKHILEFWDRLSDAHVPADYITTVTPDELDRYRVLVTDQIRVMSEETAATIRDWVRRGGILIALGDVATCDLLEEAYPQPPLADVLGVTASGTYYEDQESLTVALTHPAVAPLAADETLPYGAIVRVGYGTHKAVEVRDGYALAPAESAKVIARWHNGEPAMIINTYGEGKCLYSGAFPQFCPRPQATALAGSIASWALDDQLPVEVRNFPASCDVSVLSKPGKLMVHLLNLEPWQFHDPDEAFELDNIKLIKKAQPLTDVQVRVALPSELKPTRLVEISPELEQKRTLQFSVADGYATFTVPRLEFYSVFVLE